jgi:plastocyanin
VAAAALGLLLAGCGESRRQASSTATNASPPPTAPSATADFTVTEREYSLTPPDLKVSKTGTFILSVRNAGGIPHALEVEAPGGTVKTGAVAPGRTAQLKVALTKPGRYAWYCPIDGHKGRGMVGTVIVAGGAGGEVPGPSGGSAPSGGAYQNYP